VLFAAALIALWALRDVLMLMGFAAVLAFALEPLVALLERIRLPRAGAVSRSFAAAIVMLLLVAIGAWALAVGVPQLVRELGGFVEGLPDALNRVLGALRDFAASRQLTAYLGPLGGAEAMDASAVIQRWGMGLVRAVGSRLGELSALIGLALIPILAFYLLTEREAVETSMLGFVPRELRPRARQVLAAIDRAMRSYVRGQSLVCLTMGVLVGLALQLIGLPVAALLGTLVALAEVVPILGFWLASAAIVLTGWGVSPAVALTGFGAYLAINQLVAYLVTPRVMSRHMKMHPFVVMVSILAGGTLMGAPGAVLALPLAAGIQSVISEFAPGGGSDGSG
jgi:predicted PurR-regulated permease PerM